MKTLITLSSGFALSFCLLSFSFAGQDSSEQPVLYALVSAQSELQEVQSSDILNLYRNGYGLGSAIKLEPVHQHRQASARAHFSQSILKWSTLDSEFTAERLNRLSHKNSGAECEGVSLGAMFAKIRGGSIGYVSADQLQDVPSDLKAIPIVQ